MSDTPADDRVSRIPVMARSLAWDAGLPVGAYAVARLLSASTYHALVAGTLAAAVRTVWVAYRQRRFDPFGIFLMAVFGVGFVLTFLSGDARFLLAKDAAGSATAAIVLLGSCAIGKPLAYYAAQRFGTASDDTGVDPAATRRRWYVVSLVWGAGLLIDAALRVLSIYTLPLDTAVVVSQILMVIAYGALIAWTTISGRRRTSRSPR